MEIITEKLTLNELKKMALDRFGNLVKAVVDIEKRIIAVDAELHSDLEAMLLEKGSKQNNLWGINLYPEISDNGFIEFDSIINLKPSLRNRSRGVEDEKIRSQIVSIVEERIKNEPTA